MGTVLVAGKGVAHSLLVTSPLTPSFARKDMVYQQLSPCDGEDDLIAEV